MCICVENRINVFFLWLAVCISSAIRCASKHSLALLAYWLNLCVCVRVRACVCVDFFFQLNTLYLRKKEYIVWKTAVFTVYQLFASVVKHLACIYTAWSSISLYLLDKQSRFCCVHVSLYSFHLICPSFISFSVSLPRNQACARILPSSTLFLPEWNL